ncbi:MAG: hypothetical protein ACUVUU_09645 [bacterium]
MFILSSSQGFLVAIVTKGSFKKFASHGSGRQECCNVSRDIRWKIGYDALTVIAEIKIANERYLAKPVGSVETLRRLSSYVADP